MARAKKTPTSKLTTLEETFLSIYMQNGFNATAAYLLANPGVTYDTARTESSKALARPNVQRELEVKKMALRNKENIELSFLVQNLKSIVYDVMQETTERDQDGRITNKPDRANLIKAIDTLAKLGGHYTQKIDLTSNGNDILQEIKINIVAPKKEE